MIPYDDLVAALSAWRARQGLPVTTTGGGAEAAPQPGSGPTAVPGSGPQVQPGSGPYGTPGSGPYGTPGSGPHRGGPPTPPPPPMAEEAHEVEAEMLEAQYDTEGGDYAMSFGNQADEQTVIGGAPEQPTDGSGASGPSGWNGGGGRNDW